MSVSYVSLAALEICLRDLEFLINKTPSGEARDSLCDAQILLMKAYDELRKS